MSGDLITKTMFGEALAAAINRQTGHELMSHTPMAEMVRSASEQGCMLGVESWDWHKSWLFGGEYGQGIKVLVYPPAMVDLIAEKVAEKIVAQMIQNQPQIGA